MTTVQAILIILFMGSLLWFLNWTMARSVKKWRIYYEDKKPEEPNE